MDGAILSMLRGAERASGLEAATCAKRDVRYFEHCDRTWLNEYLDWERFRAIGRLPLFGLSYTALILIPIVFFLLAFYNAHVVQLRQLADTIATSWDTTTPAFIQQAAAFIVQHLHPHPIPSQSFLLLLSTLCIGIASTLYTVFCPSRIKEFSRDQWCDQHKNYLIHYWPYAWRRPLIRVACAIFHFLGGAGITWVIGTKVYRTAVFIWDNSAFSFL